MLELVVFYFAAIAAVGGAILMIMQRNPVASVLYMIVSLVAQAVLFIQLNAIFVGAMLIIVYAGAILVLFLFVIMLLNLRGEKYKEKRPVMGRSTKLAMGIVLFFELAVIIQQMAFPQRMNTSMVPMSADFGAVKPVSELLYTKYLYPFELTSILLLAAIVGAVVMAHRDKSEKEEQN